MSDAKFKTMRHIETVRNYINGVIKIFIDRAESHDQTKIQEPEAEIFEIYTPKLRQTTYGSEEYQQYLREMNVGLDHHYKHNRHHPEYHKNGIDDMNLIDLIEMLIDWKAASLRHEDGNIYESIKLNQERFGYSDDMRWLLERTMSYIERSVLVNHVASES